VRVCDTPERKHFRTINVQWIEQWGLPIGTLAVELLHNRNVPVGAVSAAELRGKSSVFV
jgi:hypothetical protein